MEPTVLKDRVFGDPEGLKDRVNLKPNCRPRLDTAPTTAPSSSSFSFSGSPTMAPASEETLLSSLLKSSSMLPAAALSAADEEIIEGGVHSPPHKIQRGPDDADAAVAGRTMQAILTPRMKETLLSTPRVMRTAGSPPPLIQSKSSGRPPLMRALEGKSLLQVRAALQECPSAAKELFWDHGLEPPLCCAVRCECSAAIVKLMLEHGADPEAHNVQGCTPAQILGQQPRQIAPPMFLDVQWAQMLPALDPLWPRAQDEWQQEIAQLQAWHQEVVALLNRQV